MKDALQTITPSDFILFESKKNNDQRYKPNILRDYIRAMKFFDAGKINFSYIPEHGSMIDSISIQDNLLLQTSQNIHLINNNINTYLEINENKNLMELLKLIPSTKWSPAFLNSEGKKIVTIINAILRNSSHIIVEAPETSLMPETLNLMIDGLIFEAKNNDRTIILANPKSSIWNKYINKIITPCDDNTFIISNFKQENVQTELTDKNKNTQIQLSHGHKSAA